MNDFKLFAFDMDGTLLNSRKQITPSTKAALDALARRGVYTVVATGRGLAELSDYRDALKAVSCGILLSGGVVFDFVHDAPIKVHALDETTILRLIDFGLTERAMIHLHTVRHSIACADDIGQMAAFDMEVYQSMFERICVRCDDFKAYVHAHPGEVIKVNLYHRSRESRDRNFERIKPLKLSVSFAEACNLEMSPADITKGSGLVEVCDFLQIALAETVAIGDAPNDAEILQAAGLAVVMGNASDAIKKLGDLVTADNDSDGVAEAIDKIFG